MNLSGREVNVAQLYLGLCPGQFEGALHDPQIVILIGQLDRLIASVVARPVLHANRTDVPAGICTAVRKLNIGSSTGPTVPDSRAPGAHRRGPIGGIAAAQKAGAIGFELHGIRFFLAPGSIAKTCMAHAADFPPLSAAGGTPSRRCSRRGTRFGRTAFGTPDGRRRPRAWSGPVRRSSLSRDFWSGCCDS